MTLPSGSETCRPTFAKVKYSNIYPGVDAVYYGTQGRLEYDLLLAPRTDPNVIRIGIDGATKLSLTKSGDLLAETAVGILTLNKPTMYQVSSSGKREIDGKYVLRGKNELGIQVKNYDVNAPLVVDPVLVYSTYLGGTSTEFLQLHAGTVDAQGNMYLTGVTTSTDFPATTTLGPVKTDSSQVVFVTKINPSGTGLVYSTYLSGGNGSRDASGAIAVDSNGLAYVTGETNSTSFPVTSTAYQQAPAQGSPQTVFVSKLSADGQSLLYSTYLGGVGYQFAEDIAVDANQVAYVSGALTTNASFPVTSNAFQTVNHSIEGNAFVSKIDTTQSGAGSLVYSTLLGGSGNYGELGTGVAVGSGGKVYVSGDTSSADFPVTSTAYQSTSKAQPRMLTGYLSEIDTTQSGAASLIYSTFFGGSAPSDPSGHAAIAEIGLDVKVDALGKVYMTGDTESSDFPLTVGPTPTITGLHGFVAKFDPTQANAASLVYSRVLGNGGFTAGASVAVDSLGDAYVVGSTSDPTYPVTADAVQPTMKSPSGSLFLTIFTPDASNTLYSTYFGDSTGSENPVICLDSVNNIYMAGESSGIDLPTTEQTYQSTVEGAWDLFTAKFSAIPAFPSISSITPGSGVAGTSITVTGQNFGSSQGTSTITFHGTTATPTSWNSGSIVVPVPMGATSGNIVVTVGAVASNPVNFSVGTQTVPTISSLLPNTAGVGAPITILGTNFGATQGSSTVTFNGTVATPTFWSTTTIQVPVPSGATTGNIVVTVAGVASSGKPFTVPSSGPTISSLSPNFGTTGTVVTINGTGFGSAQGSSVVKFNTTSATPTSWSDTQIVAADPTGASDGNVVVTVNGVASNGIWFPEAHITSISPTSGPVGTSVRVTGTNFRSTAGTVFLNGVPATVTGSWSNNLTVTVPAGAGSGNIVVETYNNILSNGVNFTVTGGGTGPLILGMSPTSGAVGSFLAITGVNFGSTQGSSSVTFNGIPATTTSWGASAIGVVVPSGATNGNVVVTVGGVPSNGVLFTVTSGGSGPNITGIYPTAVMVGQNLTVTGSGFGASQGSGFVSLGATNATVASWSNTQVVVTIPTGTSSGQLYVQQAGANSDPVPFTIITAPSTATEYSYDPMGRVAQTYSCAPANCGTGQGWLMGSPMTTPGT